MMTSMQRDAQKSNLGFCTSERFNGPHVALRMMVAGCAKIKFELLHLIGLTEQTTGIFKGLL
jgi:hypothetical protein